MHRTVLAHVERPVGEGSQVDVVLPGIGTGPRDDDVGAGAGEGRGNGVSDAARAAGHQDRGAAEVESERVGHSSTPKVIMTFPQSFEPSRSPNAWSNCSSGKVWVIRSDRSRRARSSM